MNLWSTFRLVPPVAPEAMAWATLSFATYLAASEMHPVAFGHIVDPLALALAVQMILSMTKNMTSDRFITTLRIHRATALFWVPFWCVALFIGFAALALLASAAVAAKLFILYQVLHAFKLVCAATFFHQHLPVVVGTWTFLRKNAQNAVMLEAAGLLISAMTLFTVWTYAGPMAFAAMMSFGVLVVKTLSNWVIVLYLLDAQKRASDE